MAEIFGSTTTTPLNPNAFSGGGTSSNVHVGSSEPQGDANVWINPEGETDLIFEDIIGMPEYAIAERDSVLNKLYAKMNLGNVSIIGFSTDQHISKWEDMQKSTNTKGTIFGLRALNSLAQKIPFNLICLGGDYNTGGSVSSIQQEVLTVQEQFANAPCPVVAVTGNHDAWQNTEDMTSGDIFKSHFMQEVIKNRGLVNLDNMTTNGYIDDSTVNIRYIFVDSDPHKEYTDDDIRSALSQMLRETPEEYKAVVFSHKPLSDELGEDWHDGWNFDSILQTYKNKIICCINGHSHIDSSTISNGILFIQTRAAAPTDYNGNADLSTAGTADETAFDVFIFDLDTNNIYSIRYGGGKDRNFNIPISVYGYTTDKRVNSSGVEKDEPNHQVTGFIPFTYGDVLYMSSDVFDNVTGNCNIVGYDSDKNFISSSYVDNSYGTILDENNYYSFDPSRADSGTSQWKNVAYVRVTGTGITDNSVITVNQPI